MKISNPLDDIEFIEFEFSSDLEFATKDDFFTYIEQETYLVISDTPTPVCFGINLSKDETSGEWDIDIYLND